MKKLLEINDLKVTFSTHLGNVQAVRGISMDINEGEAVGIVGESGSGKSVTMMSILGLLGSNCNISGNIIFNDKNLSKLPEKEMEKIRGNEIAMIFQDPMTSLNPVFSVGFQLTEPIKKHKHMNKNESFKRAIGLLDLVGISNSERRMKQYPHEFSGGMRQRAMIAMAMSCNPKLLIADEPTTALDVTIQAQILNLMKDLKEKTNMSLILITHDLGVVADVCSKIYVMYGGIIVEKGSIRDIFYRSRHPYTWGLLKSIPDINDETKKRLVPIYGSPPDLIDPPKGCPFAPRCDYTMNICLNQIPEEFEIENGHKSACFLNHAKAPKIKNPAVKEIKR